MKRVFVLEDSSERIKQFKQRFLEQGWIGYFSVTASDAIRNLDLLRFDLIFLDHDLGGQVYVNKDEKNTGSEVARWIREHPVVCPIIIHSLNPAGAEYMKSILPKAVHIPFVWNKKEFDQSIGEEQA
jgi:CheY-like chemotaxis protein